MVHTSPWLEELPAQTVFPALVGDLQVDVAVVGAGMNGMLTAYFLATHGVSVALIEKSSICSGESGYTTAFLTQIIDLPLSELVQRFGASDAAQIWTAGQWAITRLEEICTQEKIACDLLACPALIFTQDESGEKSLKAELVQAELLGFAATWEHNHLQFSTKGHITIPQQGKFHPRKFLTGLSSAIEQHGGQVFEKTKVTKILSGTESGYQLITPQGSIYAQKVVICTHLPQLIKDIWTPPVEAWQTYAIEAHGPATLLPEAIFWDTAAPYHYFRVDRQADNDRIILGGEDHLMGETPTHNPHEALEGYLAQLFPGIPFSFTAHWSGQILETADGLPLIGAINPEKTLFVGTGFSGNGMTFSTISAQINTHLILHGRHAWAPLFDPLRFKSI